VSLYDIEKTSFVGNNIIDELSRTENENQPYDFAFADFTDKDIVNSDYTSFLDSIYAGMEALVEKMAMDGVIF